MRSSSFDIALSLKMTSVDVGGVPRICGKSVAIVADSRRMTSEMSPSARSNELYKFSPDVLQSCCSFPTVADLRLVLNLSIKFPNVITMGVGWWGGGEHALLLPWLLSRLKYNF